MQAGRELDLKVAMALGWKVSEGDGIFFDEDGHVIDEPKFSTSWEGMGVLVEEAKKEEIYLDFAHTPDGGYCGFAGVFKDGKYQIDHNTPAVVGAPYAVSLAYLMAKGIAV
ncbi:hypothetical protein [Brevibacillus sp. MER 51]|jgi:hypothetical protein|uniref:hypothetical protein n=1 Tax=Brevibacillus sp. MER 51 TaxID=2939560 RepID=UPI00203D25DE|nr:hypothetical protein [Brevibacillus sp. MER 51]MCM3143062.1 hypothetical protein [Brevibacillus sp. MER 51]